MPRKNEGKSGRVFLKQVEPGKWRASWTDPVTRKHTRRVLPCSTYADANRIANQINATLAEGRGYAIKLRGRSGHSVTEAGIEAIRHTDANAETRRDYSILFNGFIGYLETNAPAVQSWGQVRTETVENYLAFCRRKGLSFDSIRKRIFAVRMVAKFMARTYGHQNPTDGVKLKRRQATLTEQASGQDILSAAQLRGFLAWLRDREPLLHVLASLEGLTGLRMLEGLYLREGDVDVEKRVLKITVRGVHRLKNRHSIREIPVCDSVMVILGEWMRSMKVRHLEEGYLFLSEKGQPFRTNTVSQLFTKTLKAARLEGLDISPRFVVRKLRASFITAMREAGADVPTLQVYCGHCPATILSAFYDRIGLDRLRVIARLADDLATGQGAFGKAKSERIDVPVLR
jgi:site-specific recombinase XerD